MLSCQFLASFVTTRHRAGGCVLRRWIDSLNSTDNKLDFRTTYSSIRDPVNNTVAISRTRLLVSWTTRTHTVRAINVRRSSSGTNEGDY